MQSSYATVALALAMAYQSVAAEWHHSWRRGSRAALYVLLSLSILAVMPWLGLTSLRVGWSVSGVVLCCYAMRAMRGRAVWPLVLLALDSASGWVALALTGASWTAVATGAAAGAMLPAAFAPWPDRIGRLVHLLGTAGAGAAGLRELIKAASGGRLAVPWLLLVVPWLIIWDWQSAHAATG